MEPLKSIEQEWQVFATSVFKGVQVSCVQYLETKRAFFAGAFVMLKNMERIGEPDISEEDGVTYLDDRIKEAEKFFGDTIREYAEGN